MFCESICFLEVINQQGPCLRRRHTKAIEINLLVAMVSPQADQVAFVGDDISKFILPEKAAERGIRFAGFLARLN
jgi:hypothetical protein